MTIDHVVEKLRESLPPVFAGQALDELTGRAINWRTVQNLKSLKQIPSECFAYSGRKGLVLRDPFLEWWRTTLRAA